MICARGLTSRMRAIGELKYQPSHPDDNLD